MSVHYIIQREKITRKSLLTFACAVMEPKAASFFEDALKL